MREIIKQKPKNEEEKTAQSRILQRCLQSVLVEQFTQTLDQIEHGSDRLMLSQTRSQDSRYTVRPEDGFALIGTEFFHVYTLNATYSQWVTMLR